jgi:hypothetical protein
MKSWRRCASDERCAACGLPLFKRFSDKQDAFAPKRYIGEMDMRMTVFAARRGVVGAASVSAAPLNATAIGGAAAANSAVATVVGCKVHKWCEHGKCRVHNHCW